MDGRPIRINGYPRNSGHIDLRGAIVLEDESRPLLAYDGLLLPLLTAAGIDAFFGVDEEKHAYAHDVLARWALDGCECRVEGAQLVLSGAIAPTVPGDSACNAYVCISLADGALLSAQCPFCATLDNPGSAPDADVACCHGYTLMMAFLQRPWRFSGCPSSIRVLAGRGGLSV